MDRENPASNDFLSVSQLSVTSTFCLPPGFAGLRQWPAAGGHDFEETRPEEFDECCAWIVELTRLQDSSVLCRPWDRIPSVASHGLHSNSRFT